MKKPPLDNAYIVKYIRPSLKNKKLLMSLKDLCINSLNNTMKLATVSRDLTAPLKKRMQHFFKKDFSKKVLSFLINRTGRRVTKLYWHYAFEQERFKRNFIWWISALGRTLKIPLRKIFIRLWTTLILDMIWIQFGQLSIHSHIWWNERGHLLKKVLQLFQWSFQIRK